MKRILTFVLCAAIFCGTASGWGRQGHSTIAKIAENNLKPSAKKKIEKYESDQKELIEKLKTMKINSTDENLKKNYIKKLFKEDYLNAKIRKQIRDFRKEYQYTYSGMLKTLYWWYEIKGNSIDLAQGGIGIIPFIYDDALKYYYSIFMAQTINENKEINKPKVKEIEIGSPRAFQNPPKLFNFGEE